MQAMKYESRSETRLERYRKKLYNSTLLSAALVTVEFHGDANLGFVVRAAACFGAKAVHVIGSIPKHRELKKYSGSTEWLVDIVQHKTPAQFMSWRRELGASASLVVAELRDSSRSLHEFTFDPSVLTLIVVGNETSGVPEELVHRADHVLYVPMPGAGWCLNTAQAANVMMYEYARQMAMQTSSGVGV